MAGTKQQRATTPIYVGFTTFQRLAPPYSITDIDCVKQDLLNEFQTKVGERVMLPEYGSIIHELLFDPFDDLTKQAIIDDVERIVRSDPRVELENTNVKETDYGLQVELVLIYTPSHSAETLFIDFVRETEGTI
jgi:phage baseplate assembly protein W